MAGDIPLPSLTMQHLDNFKIKRLIEVSAVTVNRELQALRASMNTAVSWKFIEINPFSKMKQLNIPEQQPKYFSKIDFQKLIFMINENWLKEIIVFAVLTGMRRGEILNLRWQDIDLQQKTIHIQSNPTFRTKQGKHRVIPMNEIVFNLLTGRKVNSSCEYTFHLDGRKINDDYVTKKLKRYIRDSHLDGRLHFHSLRHTFATWLVQGGVNIYEVQKLLGHSSVKVTEVYSHLAASELHGAVNKITLPLN